MTDTIDRPKVAIVVDSAMPSGLAANTAAVLALTLGSRVGSLLGPDLKDADGSVHLGITTVPIPILTAATDALKALRRAALEDQLLVVDFTDCAQRTRTYEDYESLLAEGSEATMTYLGVALCGPRKNVQRLTGSLPLLR
jgi:hypothetical protein